MTNDEIIAALTSLRADAAAKAKAHADTQKAIDGILKALKDPARNAVALGEEVAALKKSGQGVAPSETYELLARRLTEIADKVLDDAAFAFARDLRAAFEAEGVTLNGSGERFVAEPFIIEVDKQRGKVNLKFGRETMNAKPVALDPARVVAAYHTASKALAGRRFNPGELLRQFFEAYNRVIASAGAQPGERANVVDCYRELVWLKQSDAFRRAPAKNSFADYPRAHFTYDMLQLRRQNLLTHKNHRLHFGTATIDATGNESRAIWMPDGADEGRYIMDVYWTKEA